MFCLQTHYMAENLHGSTISGARTWQEMAEFWDTHSLAEYHDQTYAVEMTFDPAARRTAIVIEPDLLDDLTEAAGRRGIARIVRGLARMGHG